MSTAVATRTYPVVGQLPPRLRSKVVVQADGCWLWKGAVGRYGMAWWNGTTTTAHRVVWLALGLPVLKANHLHHVCANYRCVNPRHVQPIDPSTHMRISPTAVRMRSKTHCVHGHTLADAYIRPDGRRRCRTCEQDRSREAQRAKRRREVVPG